MCMLPHRMSAGTSHSVVGGKGRLERGGEEERGVGESGCNWREKGRVGVAGERRGGWM